MEKGFWTIIEDIIRRSDVVLEVLDARLPELTRIKKIEEYASSYNKPLIFVINKSDLVSRYTLGDNAREYDKSDTVITSTTKAKGIGDLIKKVKSKAKIESPKVAVIGYPNTGKSSLINKLSRSSRTRTSAESGFTRGYQLIIGKNKLKLFDTPGIVPFEDRDEVRLGLVSGISPSKLKNPDVVALKLIGIFKEKNPVGLGKAYGIDAKLSPEDFLEEIGKKNNMLMKGGIVDERRASVLFLTDWHKGKIRL
ncbi:GTPase [Nanoarchaeota archaeon]